MPNPCPHEIAQSEKKKIEKKKAKKKREKIQQLSARLCRGFRDEKVFYYLRKDTSFAVKFLKEVLVDAFGDVYKTEKKRMQREEEKRSWEYSEKIEKCRELDFFCIYIRIGFGFVSWDVKKKNKKKQG